MKCNYCKKETEVNGFATFRTQSGELRKRGVCKECRGQYAHDNFDKLKKYREGYHQKSRTKKRQKDFDRRIAIKKVIDEIKSKANCADCKKQFPSVAMDFDHVKGKNKAIANMVSGAYKIDLILEEIKLCEIVCACCHRVRTHNKKQNLALGKL